ncbi:hypothetical protein NIES4102_14450 [Chondrocystis sp. NIES-4102]|nr:hypothetical protein NIES4102_14450 [Chondrocystis sp. NIES-4102]
MISFRKSLVAFFLVCCLFISSCAQQPPSRFDAAQQESTKKGATAVVDDSQSGGSFNRYFPGNSEGYEQVYSQEKKGFAQAKLKKDGKDVAVLAISDVLNNPSTVQKFQESTKKIKGYPVIEQGTTATAMLVGDRYQIKIRSQDPNFDQSEREKWLGKFDLRGLSQVK